jgi:hypothetical protein
MPKARSILIPVTDVSHQAYATATQRCFSSVTYIEPRRNCISMGNWFLGRFMLFSYLLHLVKFACAASNEPRPRSFVGDQQAVVGSKINI